MKQIDKFFTKLSALAMQYISSSKPHHVINAEERLDSTELTESIATVINNCINNIPNNFLTMSYEKDCGIQYMNDVTHRHEQAQSYKVH